MEAANNNRWGHRDATAILLAYRHGLRASELVALRWDDIELATGRLHVRRAKGGATSVHPIGGKESRALRRLQREQTTASPYVFVSERGAPLSVAGYQRMVARAGESAKFGFLIHSHMLRHSCGYKLANDGQTPEPSSITLATARLPLPCATPLWRRIGSSTSGRTSHWSGFGHVLPNCLPQISQIEIEKFDAQAFSLRRQLLAMDALRKAFFVADFAA